MNFTKNENNILQYEFHTAGVIVPNPEKKYEDRIRPIIRIYDMDGKVTEWVSEVNRLRAQRESDLKNISPRLIPKGVAQRRFRYIDKRINELRSDIFKYAIDYLDSSFKDKFGVSVQKKDFTFIVPSKDDLQKLTEAIRGIEECRRIMLFVFEPNDLLSEGYEPILNII